jgi:two-component system response regulator NreC
MTDKIRVVIADDHAILRSGLRLLINSQSDMETVAVAGDFSEALKVCRETHPNVVMLDLNMPAGSSARAIASLVSETPGIRILVLTMHDDPAYLRAALAAGAHGYVLKKAADTELLVAIRAVAQGRSYVNVEFGSKKSVEVPQLKGSSSAAPIDTLSDREQKVFRLLAFGYTNQEIAEKLDLSVKTVESYRARLMTKLNCQTRAELTRCAVEAGLLKPGSDISDLG